MATPSYTITGFYQDDFIKTHRLAGHEGGVCRGLVVAWLSARGDLKEINQAQAYDVDRITQVMDSADMTGHFAANGLIQIGEPIEGDDLGNSGGRANVLNALCQPGCYLIGLHSADGKRGHALGAIKERFVGGRWFDPNNSQNVLSSDALYRRTLEYIIKRYALGREYMSYLIYETFAV